LKAVQQKDGFFRCEFLEKGRVYICIYKTKPVKTLFDCRVEPEGGIGHYGYDTIRIMKVRIKCETVLWDTTCSPRTVDEKRETHLKREALLAQSQANDRLLQRRENLARQAAQNKRFSAT